MVIDDLRAFVGEQVDLLESVVKYFGPDKPYSFGGHVTYAEALEVWRAVIIN